MNVIGLNRVMDGSMLDVFTQGGPVSRAMNLIPEMNTLARTHDYWLRGSELGGLEFNLASNFGTMVPAGTLSYGAILGQAFQSLNHQQLIDLSLAVSSRRKDYRQGLYTAAVIGGG